MVFLAKIRGASNTFNFLNYLSPNPSVMTITNLLKTVDGLKKFVHDSALKVEFRARPEDFTRDRLLPFHRVVSIILSALKRPLDLELKVVFDLVDGLDCPTDSAFSQARKKLLSKFFVDWLERQSELVYGCPYETFMGFRLVGVDGSAITLPDNAEMRKTFPGVNIKGVTSVQARILCCHDVLNNHAVTVRMAPSNQSEVDMAFNCVSSFGARDLLIYDRLFLGWGLIRMHQLKSVHFLIRCVLTGNNRIKEFVKSGKDDEVVEFKASHKSSSKLCKLGFATKVGDVLTVRLLRVDIGGKEPEVLATSLIDNEKFPHSIFKELYFKRWPVETFFDRLKNKLKVEIFSGTSVEAVKQDFYAMVFLANLQSMFERTNRPKVEKATKNRLHNYQIDWNKNLGLLKPMITTLFAKGDQSKHLKTLLMQMAMPRYLEPIRTGRKFTHKKKVRQLNSKHNNTLNYRHAI